MDEELFAFAEEETDQFISARETEKASAKARTAENTQAAHKIDKPTAVKRSGAALSPPSSSEGKIRKMETGMGRGFENATAYRRKQELLEANPSFENSVSDIKVRKNHEAIHDFARSTNHWPGRSYMDSFAKHAYLHISNSPEFDMLGSSEKIAKSKVHLVMFTPEDMFSTKVSRSRAEDTFNYFHSRGFRSTVNPDAKLLDPTNIRYYDHYGQSGWLNHLTLSDDPDNFYND